MEIEAPFKNTNIGSVSSNSVPINQPIGTYSLAKFYPESFLCKLKVSQATKEFFLLQATTALEYYNSSHEDSFELVDCLYINDVSFFYWEPVKYYHLSFIARRKDPSPKIKLFFAEVSSDLVVTACTPVEPGNLLFRLGCGSCHPEGVIYHPVGGNYEQGSRRCFDYDTLEKSAKQWLKKNYSFIETVENFTPGEHKELSKITNAYALKALHYYCYLKECDYELSEILASVRFYDHRAGEVVRMLDATVYVHVTFMAKNKDSHGDPEPFFAELNIDDGAVVFSCVNMTQGCEASYEAETRCKACRVHCNMGHPEGRYVAGITEGIFADAQDKNGAQGVKVELQKKKVGSSCKSARVPDSKSSLHLRLQSGEDLPTLLLKGRPKKILVARRCDARLATRQSKGNTIK